MPKPLVFHIAGRKLVIALLLTVVPISLAALYAATRAGETTAAAAGRHLEAVAQAAAGSIEQQIEAKVVEAALMASDAAVLEVVRNSNRQYFRVRQELIRERLLAKDQTWVTPQGEALVEQTMSNAGSQALRRKLTVDPSFLRITVTDLEGATVAATHKTLDYYQADEEYWQDIYFYGRGVVSLTDVLYDEATKNYYIGVGVPVVRETNQIMGTLDALVQVGSLLPALHRADLGGGRQGVSGEEGRGGDFRDGRVDAGGRGAIGGGGCGGGRAGQLRGPHVGGRSMRRFRGGGERGWRLRTWDCRSSIRSWTGWWWRWRKEAGALGVVSMATVLIMGIALLSLACVVFLIVYFALHQPRRDRASRRGDGNVDQGRRRLKSAPTDKVVRKHQGSLPGSHPACPSSPSGQAKWVRGPSGRGASRAEEKGACRLGC